MPVAAWILLGAAVAGFAALVMLVTRVRSLGQRVGSFECGLRREGRTRWASGIASYGFDRLDWYRVLSFAPRPARSWPRSGFELTGRASRLSGGRRTSITELRCRSDDEEFFLAMSEQAYAGLTSWLEAAPPGVTRGLR